MELFAPEAIPRLREALTDFSMLLTKGYGNKSALKLVGDRFSLTQRQRLAVMRAACSDQQLKSRLEHCVSIEALAGRPIAIDGYNLLITIEAAMSGGLLFRGRDGCLRDLASIHGTYRKVEETIPAVKLIGGFLSEIHVGQVLWLFDSPVSNSGRLKTLLAEVAHDHAWPWEIRLTISPDAELKSLPVGWGSPHQSGPTDEPRWGKPHPTSWDDQPPVVVSTDSVILDACHKWTNLAAEIVTHRLPSTIIIIDLA